jgi:hypothetical protein
VAKRLYTEANVRELPAGSELVLGKEAIATPAALELAFARGVRVRYGDGTSTPGAATPAAVTPGSDGLWKKLLAQDGSYVLEVKAGRARVFRLEAGGPVLVGEGS